MAQAANAAESGVCVDLFVITNEYTDLASLKYLSIESGGSLILYSSTDEATLPQDLYVHFQQAFPHDRVVHMLSQLQKLNIVYFKDCTPGIGHCTEAGLYMCAILVVCSQML